MYIHEIGTRKHSVRRQEPRQMCAYRDRSDAGPATAVRNTKSLVQIQVRNVGAELPRRSQADQRIEVRAVDIDLSSVGVHDVAYLFDPDLEHAVGRRIRDHDRREIGAVSLGLGPQIVQVDVAVFVACDDDHLHARHVRRRRIGAMRRSWNEAHLAQRLTARGVIRLDH